MTKFYYKQIKLLLNAESVDLLFQFIKGVCTRLHGTGRSLLCHGHWYLGHLKMPYRAQDYSFALVCKLVLVSELTQAGHVNIYNAYKYFDSFYTKYL